MPPNTKSPTQLEHMMRAWPGWVLFYSLACQVSRWKAQLWLPLGSGKGFVDRRLQEPPLPAWACG